MKKLDIPKYAVWAINFFLFCIYWFMLYALGLFFILGIERITDNSCTIYNFENSLLGITLFITMITIIFKEEFYLQISQ